MNQCPQCNQDIQQSHNGVRKFCGPKCKTKYAYWKKTGPLPKRECKLCKVDITSYRRDAVFCSDQCGIKFYNSNRDTRDMHLRLRYGISSADWEALFNSQNRVCLICKEGEDKISQWHTDHDHSCCSGSTTCGKCIRGILCRYCNSNLGWYETHKQNLDNYLGQDAAWHTSA